ncbi:MAG: hypothetical protein WCI94_23470, partial [Rhodospirillales bacterium]
VEEALRITEKSGGEAVGFCIGPERSEAAIRSALAMGLSRAVWIAEPAAAEADVITQSRILAAAIKGAVWIPMPGTGHFPMTEDYPTMKRFLMPVLEEIAARQGG